jgi:purine-binding chemotaxis protein CheW
MSNVPQTLADSTAALASYDMRDFVTMKVGGQLFGIPVLQVQDVLNPQRITKIPLAAPEIAGALNLRGRIVTAIDMRTRLGLPATDKARMSIVVEYKTELYSLLVDEVGDVMSLTMKDYENSPPTLDARWRDVADGVYRLDDRLMLVIDVAKLLRFTDVVEEEQGMGL